MLANSALKAQGLVHTVLSRPTALPVHTVQFGIELPQLLVLLMLLLRQMV